MAKLRGAAKAAFLRRMARGRAKARRKTSGYSTRKVRRRRRRNPNYSSSQRRRVVRLRNPYATIANPGGALALYDPRFAASQLARVRRRKRKGKTTMAKRRRKRRHTRQAAAPRRRRRRGSASRRIRRAVRVPRRYAHRFYKPRGRRRIYLNPRGRRGRRRIIRRRRNPGFSTGGLLKRVLVPYAVGFITSMGVAVLDGGLAAYPMAKQLVKVGGAFLIAMAGRKYPVAATAAIATLASSSGYALGTRLAGGIVAHTPAETVKQMGAMAQTYPEMGALLQGGVGALLEGMGGITNTQDIASNYAGALNNMGDDGY